VIECHLEELSDRLRLGDQAINLHQSFSGQSAPPLGRWTTWNVIQ
jgi:hypothetical protein